MAAVYCALVHYPIRQRDGSVGTTAVTTLDVHDIARSARTFGLSGYFIVTPIAAQQVLLSRILGHWSAGAGRKRMPERSDALHLCRAAQTIEEVSTAITEQEGLAPSWVATAARPAERPTVSFCELREQLHHSAAPHLLLLGTGHGLSDDLVARATVLLEPIHGPSDYNHLSVRSAAAIIFDRLFAPR